MTADTVLEVQYDAEALLRRGAEVVLRESEALATLAQSLNLQFVSACEAISKTSGARGRYCDGQVRRHRPQVGRYRDALNPYASRGGCSARPRHAGGHLWEYGRTVRSRQLCAVRRVSKD